MKNYRLTTHTNSSAPVLQTRSQFSFPAKDNTSLEEFPLPCHEINATLTHIEQLRDWQHTNSSSPVLQIRSQNSFPAMGNTSLEEFPLPCYELLENETLSYIEQLQTIKFSETSNTLRMKYKLKENAKQGPGFVFQRMATQDKRATHRNILRSSVTN